MENQPLPNIPGYTLTTPLHMEGRTAVYQALSQSSGKSVVVQVLRWSPIGLRPSPSPSINDSIRLRNQYNILKDLNLPGIVKPLALMPWKHGEALVMEDVGGIFLRNYLQAHKHLALEMVMDIALQLADILHHLIQHQILHKDINPANILIHPDTHQVWLTNFNLASRLSHASQVFQRPDALEGTPAYIAPEQTGRINRGIDYRADFYSLGVTLYELLTRELPFQSNDPVELIHCHCSKAPTPPSQVSSPSDLTPIPAPLSNIVLKLMQKNAEDRYQSALGLKHDVQRCLNQWQASQSIDAFELEQADPCDRTPEFALSGPHNVHRKAHLRETLPLLQPGYAAAMKVGHYEWAGYGAYFFCANAFSCSPKLTVLEQEIHFYHDALVKRSQRESAHWCRIYWQSVLNLRGHGEDPHVLSGDVLQEDEFVADLNTAQDVLGLLYFHLYKLILCYLFGNNRLARTHARIARQHLSMGGEIVGIPSFYFYDALSALRELKTLQPDSEEYRHLLAQVNENQSQLQQNWANYAPMNYQHKVDLIAAEKSRIFGKKVEAIEYYDGAIAGSKNYQYCLEESLANELAAQFYLDWGKQKIAGVYMQDAYTGYDQWGAEAKTRDLERCYPQLLQSIRAEGQLSHGQQLQEYQQLVTDLQVQNSFLNAQRDSSLDGMLIIGADRRVNAYNQPFVSIWNIPEQLLETRDDRQLVTYVLEQLEHPTDFWERVEYLYDHPEERSHDEIKLKDQRILERYSSPVKLPSGAYGGRIWYFRDISDRKAAEQELVLKQNHLEALLNNIPHMAWVKDDQSRFIAVNEPFSRACGNPTEKIIGRTDYDLWPRQLAKGYRTDDFQVLQSNQRKIVEEKIIHADGTWRWIETTKTPFCDAQGQIAGTVGIAVDISDRKQTERLLTDYNSELEQQVQIRAQALQKNEERLRLALSATNQGFFDLNLQTDEAIVSPEYAFMLGYDPATFHETVTTWRSRLHPDDHERTSQAYRDYESGQTAQYKVEFRLQTRQGDWKWILSMGQFIEWDEAGQPTRLLGTHTDISDRKFAEIQLSAQNELLARIAQDQPLREVLNTLIQHVERTFAGVICAVLSLDKSNRLYYEAAPNLPPAYSQATNGVPIGEGIGSCGTAVFRNQTVITADIATDPLWAAYKDVTLSFGLRACWSSPITARGGEVLGTFAMYYTQVRSPQPHELDVITQMAHIAGIALEREQAKTQLCQSEATLLKAQQVAHVGNWEFDIANEVVTWSPEMFSIYGLDSSAGAPSYPEYLQMLPLESRQLVQKSIERVIQSGIPYKIEYSWMKDDGSVRYHECRAEAEQDEQGQITRLLGTTLDITDRKHAELALQSLVAGTAATIGKDFFPALVHHICTALDVPLALVTQFVDQELQSLAFVVDGEIQPNFTYNLPDTPCRDLVVAYTYYCPSNLSEHFPNHPHQSRDVDSYLGVALRDRQGQVLGSLCIFDRQPLREPERARQILKVFGSRAATELERQRTENALQNLIEGTAALTGPDFFPALVQHISIALNVSHAFVTESVDGGSRLHFLAGWADGEHLPDDTVEATGTTCLLALEQGSYYCEHEVIARFPDNPRLAPMGVDSYMGVALKNPAGQSIGTLCIFARQPIADPEHAEQILRVFGARAAAEIERQRGQAALEQLNVELEQRVEQRTQELARSEQDLRTIFNNVYDAIYIHDLDGTILDMNARALEQMGATREQILSSTIADISAPHVSLEKIPELLRRASAGEELRFEWKGQRLRDGVLFDIEVSLNKVVLGNRSVIVAGVRDISDRKQAERALQLSEAQAKATFTQAAVGIFETHLASGGKITRFNDYFCEMLGYSHSELLEKKFIELTYEEDVTNCLAFVEQLRVGDISEFLMEKRLIHKNGSLVWVLVSATMVRVPDGDNNTCLVVVQNISDRKATEQQLQSLSERLELAIESAQIGIWDWSADSNRLSWDKRMFEIYGVRPEDFRGSYQDWQERVHPDDLVRYEAGRDSRTQRQAKDYTQEFRVVRPDGTIRYVLATAFIERDAEGQPIRMVGTNLDITDRKEAELALKDAQAQFRRMTENVPGMIYRYVLHSDGSHGLSYVSSQVREIYELAPEIVLSDASHLQERMHPDDMAKTDAACQHSAETLEPFTVEHRLVLPEKGIRWIQAIARPERQENGDIVWDGVAIDISDRKRYEQEILESKAFLQTVLDTFPLSIFWKDRELRYIGANQNFLRDAGLSELQAVLGLTDFDMPWTQIEANAFRSEDQDVMQTDTPKIGIVETQVNADGIKIWIETNKLPLHDLEGQVIGVMGTYQDISDRKRAELALEQEVLRRTTIFNTSSDGIHIVDRDGNLIEANATFIRMLGYTSEEVVHLNVADWDAQWSREDIKASCQSPVRDSLKIETFETLHRRKDGSIFPVEISACSMEWDGEKSLVCIARDISERKQAEVQLQHTNEELIRATRLKDEFLATMSHELRTPLNSILGLSEALQDTVFGPLTEKQLKYLQTIEQSGIHLLNLINDILDVSKIEAGQIELDLKTTDIGCLCEASLAFVNQQALKKRISLTITLPPQPLTPLIDERRITQSLVNLLNNAVKFTPEGGSVALEIKHHQREQNQETLSFPHLSKDTKNPNTLVWESNALAAQSYITISVIDTGIGIAPENIDKLFKPFSQIDSALNRQYNGTGLGLVLVKQISELHGGIVSLISTVGVGSCFSIYLPYDTEAIQPKPNQFHDDLEPRSLPALCHDSSSLILLAEDNQETISWLVSYLENCGYRLIVAKNGIEAMDLAQTHRPSLILMDIQLPELDGLECIQQIRQNSSLKTIPIIALTAFAMLGDRERCLAAGANLYFSKPVKLKKLVHSIQTLLAQ